MATFIAATENSLVRLHGEGGQLQGETILEFIHPTSLAADNNTGTVYAGTRGEGVWAARKGEQWERLRFPEPDVFSVAVSPIDSTVYAGCEPSMLYCSSDEGGTWRELGALRDIPSRPTWSFPPRPWTSHVRSIAPSPHERNILLVGIELGGLMRSRDSGKSWLDHRPGADRDVHALAWHPVQPNRAYEAGGGGAAWSVDGGCHWIPANEGRGDRKYTWALAVDPSDSNRWFVSAATGPDKAHSNGRANAAIFRWCNNGPWQPVCKGLPQPLDSMPYALVFATGVLYAGLKNGELYASDDCGDCWHKIEVEGTAPASLVTMISLDT